MKEVKETRVNKFKDYRNSFIKDGSITFESPKLKKQTTLNCETSTLPIEEVLDTLENEDKEELFIQRQKKKKILLLVFICLGAVLVVAGLAIFAYIAWRK